MASNRSWIVSFNSVLTKETVLETTSVEIGGTAVFLGDCENSLLLVKIYEARNELPHTALIGCLSHYGRVLSFRQDKIAQFIDNSVRTARMTLNRHIPNIINVGGEIIRIWYLNQPKTFRNCGSPDQLVKDCNTTRCFNCEMPSHRVEQCDQPRRCTLCLDEDHELMSCPFVIHSANVEPRQSEAKDGRGGEKKADDPERKRKQEQQREEMRKKQEVGADKQRVRMQMEEKKACGGDLQLSTINRGKDPSTTPLTQGMLRHRFSAFWLRSVSKCVLFTLLSAIFCKFFRFVSDIVFPSRDGCM